MADTDNNVNYCGHNSPELAESVTVRNTCDSTLYVEG